MVSILYLFGPSGCIEKSAKGRPIFKIDDISYQSKILLPEEHRTELVIYLSEVDREVNFISLTFRGIEVPLSRIDTMGITLLKGNISFGETIIDNPEYHVTRAENSLRYSYLGVEHIFPVKDIRRAPAEKGNAN